MIVGHIFGIPVEETAFQLAPAGAAAVIVSALAGRTPRGATSARSHRLVLSDLVGHGRVLRSR
jgi:hypothetical protein